ncbi:MAG: hotdog fold thioesterase [Gammaproteobacteria bacterium]|nr:hotdog fold thioesterase [Gammaproteobacteria bacterium]
MAAIWKKSVNLDDINANRKDTLVEHLGIEVVEVGDDYIKASMPVDKRTHQPMGLLHGGASIALAETMGSIAAYLTVDDGYSCVGLEINGNHMRSVTEGFVYATARPVHLGRSTQVWDIRIQDEQDRNVCISRLTMAILSPRK